MFLVSMVLPAVRFGMGAEEEWISGWQCAYLVCFFLPDPMMLGYLVSNLGALFSPLLKSRCADKRQFRYRIAVVFALLSGIHALRLAVASPEVTFGIGYWVWTLSFFTLGTGFLLQSKTQSETREQNLNMSYLKTEAELAAERELSDYLRS